MEEGRYAYSVDWDSEHWSDLAKRVLINPWNRQNVLTY